VGLITSGTAAALTHATAGCLAGTDPEKIQRLPNLDGLKNEVIIPRESRNGYDHAIRTRGESDRSESIEELRAAINSSHGGGAARKPLWTAALDLKDIARLCGRRYSHPGGRSGRLPDRSESLYGKAPTWWRTAAERSFAALRSGPAVGRRDSCAAWANSAPHHAFGRAMKVTKEEIVGMLRAVEAWRTDHDLQADFEKWKSWHAHIAKSITGYRAYRRKRKDRFAAARSRR
jgi:L-seryl-tRNA(Ser) seleniumtransferase